jgi:hypothetical protein
MAISKQIVAAAATLLGVAAPAFAEDNGPTTASTTVLYYLRLPIDGASSREREPSVGFFFKGKRDYQTFNMERPVNNFLDGGILEAKYLIAGAVAAGAAVVAGSKTKSESNQQQQQQQAQQQHQQEEPCPQTPPTCPSFSGVTYRGGLFLPR